MLIFERENCKNERNVYLYLPLYAVQINYLKKNTNIINK